MLVRVTGSVGAKASPVVPRSPGELGELLRATGYLPDEGTATAAYLAMRMNRPLFCEGEPGTGKTALAQALALVTGAALIRLQCYEGIDASQALYDWDFPRQLLHLRALEAAASIQGASMRGPAPDGVMSRGTSLGPAPLDPAPLGPAPLDPAPLGPAPLGPAPLDAAAVEASLYDPRFLIARPVLRALRTSPSVLLIDEVDRADDEFEAFLLEVLVEHAVTIPEVGEVRAETPPLVVLTSNRTREVHDALKRRCLYLWLDHPDVAREVAILRSRLPEVPQRLAAQVAAAVARMRQLELLKPPGVAESLDWAQALTLLGARELDLDRAAASLGAVLKYREDADRVRAQLDSVLG